jgi:hypothetical protein
MLPSSHLITRSFAGGRAAWRRGFEPEIAEETERIRDGPRSAPGRSRHDGMGLLFCFLCSLRFPSSPGDKKISSLPGQSLVLISLSIGLIAWWLS